MHPFFRYWDNAGRVNVDILKDLFGQAYTTAVDEELSWVFRNYSVIPRYGRSHPAPCAVWRTERTLGFQENDWDARFANRIHVFDGSGGQSVTKKQVDTYSGPPDPNQRYLGYVSLRPHEHRAFDQEKGEKFFLRYTAVAMLTPPPYMERPRYHIITSLGGPAEGIIPFRSTPFCSPPAPENECNDGAQELQTAANRAPCMHAAMHAALLLKTDAYQCKPISSQDMVALVWQMDHERLISGKKTPKTFAEWNREGLRLEEAVEVLRHKDVRSGAVFERIVSPGPYWPSDAVIAVAETRKERTLHRSMVSLEALRCITDYLANGIPVIIEVTPKEKEEFTRDNSECTQEIANDRKEAHAVLVFGFRLLADPDDDRWPIPADSNELMRRVDMRELPSRMVVHDTFTGPYHVKSTADLLKSAWVSNVEDPNEATGHEGIRFVAVMPKGSQIGIQDVRGYAHANVVSRGIPSAYSLEQFSGSLFLEADSARYVTRLMSAYQIQQRYFVDHEGKPLENGDALLLVKRLLTYYQQTYNDALEDVGLSISLNWWAVEVRVPNQIMMLNQRDATATLTSEPLTERTLPIWVFFWPVATAPTVAKMVPALTLKYVDDYRAIAAAARYPSTCFSPDDARHRSEWTEWAKRGYSLESSSFEWGVRDA